MSNRTSATCKTGANYEQDDDASNTDQQKPPFVVRDRYFPTKTPRPSRKDDMPLNQSRCSQRSLSNLSRILPATNVDCVISRGNVNIKNNQRSNSQTKRPRSNSRVKSSKAMGFNCIGSKSTIEQLKEKIRGLYDKDIPEARNNHEFLIVEQNALIEQFDEDDDRRPICEALLKELKEQLNAFNAIVSSFSTCNTSNLSEVQHHWNILNREITRLELHLPIYARHLDLIDPNIYGRVLILKADTGSGKSTQLVQYLADALLATQGQIICTQPRRLAARALASRVAEEFGCKLGEEVGLHIGVSRALVSARTRIRFVTEAVLLNEYYNDPMLTAYSVVIIDEAHERRIDTDLLLGAMKICLKQRKDIRLIIMSATLDDKLLCNYYNDACFMNIPGRTFPIEDEYASEDPEDYVDAAIKKTFEILASEQSGDILVFLTGPEEIYRAINQISSNVKCYGSILLLPLHGKLNEEEMNLVFKASPNRERKIIFATNVAETSITIDGIRHVIDSGMVKEMMWDPQSKTRALKVGYTTQSSVMQRRGRAGRTAIGKCYHLYTIDTYESLEVCPRAEILCIRPSIAVLKLKYLGIGDDVSEFDWLEPPTRESIQDAVDNLMALGALDPKTKKLTEIGWTMAKLGLEPMLSAMILTGEKYNCLSYVLALAGMLQISQNVWWRGKDDESKQLGEEIRARFAQDLNIGGDHIALLRLYLEWNALGDDRRNNEKWCREHMINGKAMRMTDNFIREIAYQMKCNFKIELTKLNDDLIQRILRCVCAGFFQQLAITNGNLRAGYRLINKSSKTFARVHRSSTLAFVEKTPKFIIYHDILIINETTYLTALCPIDFDWLDKSWLATMPQLTLQTVIKSHVFENLGPALLLSIVGKKCQHRPWLEESFNVLLDPNYEQSRITVWGEQRMLANAQQHLERIIDQERGKLRTEVKEYQIIGSTRILLGAGGQTELVLVKDEYVKVLLTRLPPNVTEKQIEEKCLPYGKVRNIVILRRNQSGSLASVTFYSCDSARSAVTNLSHQIWDGRELNANPSQKNVSIHAGRQNCKLKVQWFMTKSQCSARVQFSQQEAAFKALEFFEETRKFRCRIEPITSNPTIKCSCSLAVHTGKGTIFFQSAEQAQKVLKCDNSSPFHLRRNPKDDLSLWIENVPANLDEYDLKNSFINITGVTLQRGFRRIALAQLSVIEDELRRLFNSYRSFQRELVAVMPQSKKGVLEAYVQFTDERDMQTAIENLNNKPNLIGSGKLRLSVYKYQFPKKPTKVADKSAFLIKLYQLKADIDEEVLIQDLNQHRLGDYIIDVNVFRESLPKYPSRDASETRSEEDEINLIKLQSLFSDRRKFRSAPDIQIRPATNDGRVVAFVLFDHPSDVITAMHMYETPDDPNLLKFGDYKMRLIPIIDHTIELNAALTRAIPKQIEHAIETIKRDPILSNIALIKKIPLKNQQEITRISIKGASIQKIYKARAIFEELMKGLIFKFAEPSWVSVIFDVTGKTFLQKVQDRTGTYIWWDWRSTFLRIFGNDQASNKAYQEINDYIHETLDQNKYSVPIRIPEGCIRQSIEQSSELRRMGNEEVKVTIDVLKRLIIINGDKNKVLECERKIKDRLGSYLPEYVHTTTTAADFQHLAIPTNEERVCSICLSGFKSPYYLQPCGHTFCRLCLQNYFENIYNTDALHLCCPLDTCKVECVIQDIEAILGFEKMSCLAKIAFQIYIGRQESDLSQCIGNNCDQVYRPSQYSSSYHCDQCNENYCIPCKVEYHFGMTCTQYKQAECELNQKFLSTNN
ncbi:unnamed protein product [Rotaria socialis]|uniref:RNA helicase n=1 Tax=Rotaria socialis TaxID=392032 RepID=A0A818QHD3_9BILA|nr:unnamed protein product [Rotaria socialis]